RAHRSPPLLPGRAPPHGRGHGPRGLPCPPLSPPPAGPHSPPSAGPRPACPRTPESSPPRRRIRR
ncbi:IS66 family transposase, partial [Dysosmobacter welbionis]